MVLAANIEIKEQEGKVIAMPMAVDIIYKGAICKINAAGYLAPSAAEASAFNAGIAQEYVDNSAGSAGDKVCRVATEGVFLLTSSGLTQADVGSDVFASSDELVSTTQASNEIKVGKIVKLESATKAWVKINAAIA